MTRKQIDSKALHHAGLATDAWLNSNFDDYAIETARFELACRAGARMDRAAVKLYDTITNILDKTATAGDDR